jgi:hypothetical protein
VGSVTRKTLLGTLRSTSKPLPTHITVRSERSYASILRTQKFIRCGFLSLPVDEIVGAHIDEGTYYLTRNRYHLSIVGRYQYFCGKESVIVEPGTLLWFNNKLPHGTVNIGDETRITFVFDIPHGQS